MKNDTHFMQMALALAEKGKFSCQPNPRVGCIITQGDRVIGEGFHQTAGKAHAEINALLDAEKRGESAKGATVYVTLEPCSHTGRTPPCALALISSGVARVVVATQDPNPQVSGSGLKSLQAEGIDVELLDSTEIQARANELNKAFFHKMRTGKPYVILKVATTLDGRTADAKGESQWITGELAREDVHYLRAESCAVLTGAGTLRYDNPRLNARIDDMDRQPYRVLLESSPSLIKKAKIVGNDKRLLYFSSVEIAEIEQSLLPLLGQYVCVNRGEHGLDIQQIMQYLSEMDINQIMVEAGAVLSGSFVEAGLVDEIVHYIAPSILGDKARPAFNFSTMIPFAEKFGYAINSSQVVGDDLKIVYKKNHLQKNKR